MSFGPLPSERCLLSDLLKKHVGDKVRFLGCVTGYSTHSATLALRHEYPEGAHVSARVDVKLLLEKLNAEQTDIGQWVHVIGYVTSIQQTLAKATTASCTANVGVQALVLWIAEDLDVASYEQSFVSKAD
ncbi:CST complex subunit Ten1 [Hypoxylon sp. FL1284]|nr:CST complex subunit Ten1 [Hypoxylon sp. FL1284]